MENSSRNVAASTCRAPSEALTCLNSNSFSLLRCRSGGCSRALISTLFSTYLIPAAVGSVREDAGFYLSEEIRAVSLNGVFISKDVVGLRERSVPGESF